MICAALLWNPIFATVVIYSKITSNCLVGSVRTFAVTEGMGSADGAFDKDRIPKKAGDPTRREFTYFMLGGARFIYASSARLALIKVCKEKSFLEVRTILSWFMIFSMKQDDTRLLVAPLLQIWDERRDERKILLLSSVCSISKVQRHML